MKRSIATATRIPELGARANSPSSPPCGVGGLALRAMVAMVGMRTAMPRATYVRGRRICLTTSVRNSAIIPRRVGSAE